MDTYEGECVICGKPCLRNNSYTRKHCSKECTNESTSRRVKVHNYGGFKKGSDSAKRMGEKMKKNCSFVTNPENIANNKGVKLKLTDKERKRRSDRMNKNINSKGLNIENGAKCKFFTVDGLRIQGRWELAYILKLKEQNIELPKKSKTIKTPTGFYTPDYDYGDHFIEVKSTYTIKISRETGQSVKIQWVRDNVKPVKIILMSDKKVERILSAYNLEEYIKS